MFDVCRCPCYECIISHMITCGLISPEVSDQHHHHHHHQCREAEPQQPPDHDLSHDDTSNEDTLSLSPSQLPKPLCTYDPLRYYVNIKPPSVPSSDSSSCSESPIILDRCRFFGENFEYVVIPLFAVSQ